MLEDIINPQERKDLQEVRVEFLAKNQVPISQNDYAMSTNMLDELDYDRDLSDEKLLVKILDDLYYLLSSIESNTAERNKYDDYQIKQIRTKLIVILEESNGDPKWIDRTLFNIRQGQSQDFKRVLKKKDLIESFLNKEKEESPYLEDLKALADFYLNIQDINEQHPYSTDQIHKMHIKFNKIMEKSNGDVEWIEDNIFNVNPYEKRNFKRIFEYKNFLRDFFNKEKKESPEDWTSFQDLFDNYLNSDKLKDARELFNDFRLSYYNGLDGDEKANFNLKEKSLEKAESFHNVGDHQKYTKSNHVWP